ncbi:AmmeMemoRadiSam system radical SAM enzyme [Roseimaritima sediminicola]|uniref:AmmeMemoRadiSam system radical SAM enzyme n=1 Tax=Roseimaritima sediminicola TaxID=2662066 RepID=UPI0012982E2D|nr:AmmeMemoRadiSam system radical SAM enzyme [Roseimaritima sediminicola]
MSGQLPTLPANAAGHPGRWWSLQEDGRILCQLCPRACRLNEGDRGFCFVRRRSGDAMILDTYGRSTGFCIDPVEKKPLNHFLPGTPILSFGTAGCNLGCKFCQNWDISKSREVARLSDQASPEQIADAAAAQGCRSVAFTYNDPVIWAEYAIDVAAACRGRDIKSVAVTAGYVTPEAREAFFAPLDAANIDLKAFTESFYYKVTGSHLQPVLDTIRYVCNETPCWVELTNLLIPGKNDSEDELRRMCDWILEAVGPDVPLHFSAFHPDYRMQDRPRTPHETLIRAHEVARRAGLNYAYVGNVHDGDRSSTYCPGCGELLIQRDWYQLGTYALSGNACSRCGTTIAGVFEAAPGSWGPKRQPIRIASLKPPEMNAPTPQTHDLFAADLNEEAQTLIRTAAGVAVCQAVETGQHADLQAVLGPWAHQPVAGVYVTLKRGQTLRGCCGRQGPPVPLYQAIADAAFRTATADPRMPPIQACELPYLDLSVSLIGPAEDFPPSDNSNDLAAAIQIGRHGIRIRRGQHGGLLLPSVAVERNWDAYQFLDAVCRKAGLAIGDWRLADTHVQRFEGRYFGGPVLDARGQPLVEPLEFHTAPAALADVRPPAVAGTFYPADDRGRESLVDELLAGLPPAAKQPCLAAMVPHAGLRYSGRIAADVWRRIEVPRRVVMLGPKHTPLGDNWAVAPHTRWQLSSSASLAGEASLAESLADSLSLAALDAEAHRREHAFETQLPLLYRLAPQTQLVCLAIGAAQWPEIQQTAAELAEWIGRLDEPPLLVISSDMNHFADEHETHRRDRLALERLAAGDPQALLEVCRRESISMCGQIPAALVLETLHRLGHTFACREVAYGTSAAVNGDSRRVVGYAGALFTTVNQTG